MRPSLKKTSDFEPSIPQPFASAHRLDGFARASSQRSDFMKALTLAAAVLLLGATTIFATGVFARTVAPGGGAPDSKTQDRPAPPANQDTPAAPPANPATAQPATTTTSTSGQSVTPGAAPLRVMVGKSLLINTTERLKRVSVTDPSVADALVVTPTQVLVNGLSPGEVSLLIWDELERSRSFDLRVDVDITAATEEMHRLFPNEQINVTPSRSAIVLSGHVTTEDVAKHAGALASAYSKNVVNVLTFGPVGAEEVLLEVKFAEVDRTALTQLGFNLFSTGSGNTIGSTTTGQFGGQTVGAIGDTIGGPDTTGSGTNGFTSQTTVGNLLNLFFFNPQIHMGAVVKALQDKNL